MASIFALGVDGVVQQTFAEAPALPDPLPEGWALIDASGTPDVADGWLVGADGSLAAPEPPEPVARPAITYKVDFYRRATDAEADAIEVALAAAPVRERRLFESATYLDHAAPEFASLRDHLVGMFGEERAAELLAVS